MFIEAATDNRNRTAGDIRSYFTKFGGNLGETGCVGWIFEPAGEIVIEIPEEPDKKSKETVKMFTYEELFEDCMEFDPKDVVEEDGEYKITTTVEGFQNTVEGLEKLGYKLKSSELTRVPSNSCEITDPAIVRKILLLLEKLEEHDDVQNVYSNFEADEDLINEVSKNL